MNTSATPVQTKRSYSSILCLLAGILISSMGFLTYLAFKHLDFVYAIPSFVLALIFFSILIGWLRRTIYLKYKNNALIVKGAFSKTVLTPIRSAELEPVLQISKIIVLRVNFALDGIHHSYYAFTNQSGFKMMKKRQAISRVL